MNLSQQEIERRRENANSLIAQGKLGGAEFGRLGGRPKKPRASEIIAQEVPKEAHLFISRLKEIIETGGEASAIAAINTFLKIEENERKIEENEELKFEQLKRDELIKFIAGTFAELQSQGVFHSRIDDAEFEPIEYPAIEGSGESNTNTSE